MHSADLAASEGERHIQTSQFKSRLLSDSVSIPAFGFQNPKSFFFPHLSIELLMDGLIDWGCVTLIDLTLAI